MGKGLSTLILGLVVMLAIQLVRHFQIGTSYQSILMKLFWLVVVYVGVDVITWMVKKKSTK